MMNRLFLLLQLLIFTSALQAQTYTVYSTIGTTRIVEGKKSVPLTPRKQINTKMRLYIGAESAVTVLDEKNNKMYSFSTEGTFLVGQLVSKASNKGRSISKQYMSYLVKQLFSEGSQKMTHPDTYMQVTATSYRSASSDSMLIRRIVESLPPAEGLTTEQLLCNPANTLQTDMDVRFELVSCDTGFEIKDKVEGNTGSYVRVHNNTEEALYVNVLNIDRLGNKYLILPVDEAATCAHLLVPPMSTVSFKSEPFIFSEEPSEESFILIATQDPVDFSILMNPIKGGKGKSMKSGLSRKHYRVL